MSWLNCWHSCLVLIRILVIFMARTTISLVVISLSPSRKMLEYELLFDHFLSHFLRFHIYSRPPHSTFPITRALQTVRLIN
jgi:hypothetical protein